VIVAEGDVHHRAHDHLAADRDPMLLDLVQAEDAHLRRLQDRSAEQTRRSAARDRERAALDLLDRERAVLRALGEVLDRRLARPPAGS
jgi:hypothetical protein